MQCDFVRFGRIELSAGRTGAVPRKLPVRRTPSDRHSVLCHPRRVLGGNVRPHLGDPDSEPVSSILTY